MTDPTTDELATQLAALRRKMVAAATDETTPEQRAQWKTADENMARRIHKARPRVPEQHALATLETLRAIQRYEASATDVPAEPMPDEQADARLAPLKAKARALHAQKDAEHRAAVLREAFAAISADAALREAEEEYGLAEYGRELARLVEGLVDGAPVSGEGTTADKAYAAGLTDTEYRARSHAAAVVAVRAAIPGMYAHVGHRLEDVLNEAGETQQDETQAAAGVRFFTIAEDQAHSSEPEGYDSSGCSCNPADDQYTLEIEEGGCILIHTACGKQPPSHWGDWTDLLVMQPVPVIAKWIPNCDGSEWHGDHRCDCGSTLQISPADPATLAAIALADITRQPKPAPAADAVRDQPAADTSWTILTHRNGTWTPWLGERHTAADAREDFNTTVAVHGTKWAFRLVRHDTTHTVEAEHQPDKEA